VAEGKWAVKLIMILITYILFISYIFCITSPFWAVS
jgi:hypothetical protein